MLELQKIYEISQGIDEHIRKLESFLKVLQEIKASLDEIRHGEERQYLYELQKVSRDVREITSQLRKRGLPESSRYELDLQDLRTALTAGWPEAVPAQLICDSEEMAGKRAESILDLFVGENLRGLRFLDFGCGKGHIVSSAGRRESAVAMGYDIDVSQFGSRPDCTADFEQVRRKCPFDVILLHDVLDHVGGVTPVEMLLQVRALLAPGGRVYVRNHPWSSRHGGHLYQQTNRAFLHLIFDDVELTRVGGWAAEPNVRVVTPQATYRHWFAQAGFSVRSELFERQPVEEFFLRPGPIRERLEKHWDDPTVMVDHMEICFAEYVLDGFAETGRTI